MAANKFATMINRNANKTTLILVYVVLEWTLIVLLLLNSLVSYLIIKFADYFGLKRPCSWCSRVDHVLEPGKNKNMHRDLLCEIHAREISELGYCSIHQKLAESQDMCEDCSSSRPELRGVTKNFSFFPWMKQIGAIRIDEDKVFDNCSELSLECSCCGVSLNSELYSPYKVRKPSWNILDDAQKGTLISEIVDDDHIEEEDNPDQIKTDVEADERKYEHGIENNDDGKILADVHGDFNGKKEEKSISVSEFVLEAEKEGFLVENSKMMVEEQSSDETQTAQVCSRDDLSLEIPSQHQQYFIDCSGHRLVPLELIDSMTDENQRKYRIEEDEACFGSELQDEAKVESVDKSKEEETKFPVLESMKKKEEGTENSIIFHTKACESIDELSEQVAVPQVPYSSSSLGNDNNQPLSEPEEEEEEEEEEEADKNLMVSSDVEIPVNETEADVSIGTEIPDLEITDEIQIQETHASHAYERANDYHEYEKQTIELRTLSAESGSQLNEFEEEKVPDTPTSMDSFYLLHKKLLSLERRDSCTDGSIDGSIVSDIEGGDGVLTTERLKSSLIAERKALQALYAELEEERSASAIAASQTMAMINRLQEEKAAMQMEALQYQRMMEEQSEYDQEALQLLNELMVKREKEKQELERELEVYRKKVLDYDAKEKIRVFAKSKGGSERSRLSSSSWSNAEDSDGLSIDLNQEAKEEDGNLYENGNHNHDTPVDGVASLEESFADFEEERLSILEQLKDLEEKLITLPIEEDFQEQNDNFDSDPENSNGISNGFHKGTNGKQHDKGRRIVGSKGKRLLPLFDAISAESEVDGLMNGNGEEHGLDSNEKFELENKKLEIEEEVDHLYERLQALEADREFLKHCVSSLKKGDKGMDLLQEILQHLRDLRNVDLRARHLSDGAL